MNEKDEQLIREHAYKENAEKMTVIIRNFTVCRVYNVYINLAVIVFSVIYTVVYLTGSTISMWVNDLADLEPGQFIFPGAALTAFITPAITIMTYISDVYIIKRLNRISQILYILLLIFSLTDLVFRYEPMLTFDLIVLIVYSVAGIWSQDFSLRCYDELEYLAGQEGFPTFSFLIDKDNHSRYVKYREKWLERSKRLDYFTESEKPVDDYNVTDAEIPDRMDGIILGDEKCEGWFEGKAAEASEIQGMEMDELVTEDPMQNTEEYVIEDPRYKPL